MPGPEAKPGGSRHRHKKRLGQHFLQDGNIARKIISLAALSPGELVLEIGPGSGFLTAFLLDAGVRVVAVEADADLLSDLRLRFGAAGDRRFSLVAADFLKLDLEALLAPRLAAGERGCVVANIPYNITTPIIFSLIAARQLFSRAVLMVQEEVASRLLAPPGSRLYGRLSVMAAVYCRVRDGFAVAPGCFRPPPKVRSRVVAFAFRRQPLAAAEELPWLAALVNRLFTQRRKKIINPLCDWQLSLPRKALASRLREHGFSPDCRPESLSPDDFCRLARLLVPAAPPPAAGGKISSRDPGDDG